MHRNLQVGELRAEAQQCLISSLSGGWDWAESAEARQPGQRAALRYWQIYWQIRGLRGI
jgi:hypothetical protein